MQPHTVWWPQNLKSLWTPVFQIGSQWKTTAYNREAGTAKDELNTNLQVSCAGSEQEGTWVSESQQPAFKPGPWPPTSLQFPKTRQAVTSQSLQWRKEIKCTKSQIQHLHLQVPNKQKWVLPGCCQVNHGRGILDNACSKWSRGGGMTALGSSTPLMIRPLGFEPQEWAAKPWFFWINSLSLLLGDLNHVRRISRDGSWILGLREQVLRQRDMEYEVLALPTSYDMKSVTSLKLSLLVQRMGIKMVPSLQDFCID